MLLRLILVFSLAILCGCTGYRAREGMVIYKTWDEGNGGREWPIHGADAASFAKLNGQYAKDRNHVYFRDKRISDADVATFTVLSNIFAKDASRAYFEGRAIPAAEVSSFRVIAYDYARDAIDVYLRGRPLSACDASTFHLLEDGWEIDSRCAYNRGSKLEGADPTTFKVINYWYAKDRTNVFAVMAGKRGSIVGADSTTFVVDKVCEVCARDKGRCYRFGEPVSCDGFGL